MAGGVHLYKLAHCGAGRVTDLKNLYMEKKTMRNKLNKDSRGLDIGPQKDLKNLFLREKKTLFSLKPENITKYQQPHKYNNKQN